MCQSCEIAEARPISPQFHANCKECSARAIAGGPDYFASAKAGSLTPAYRELLRTVFGDVSDGHQRVRAWAERIAEYRRVTA